MYKKYNNTILRLQFKISHYDVYNIEVLVNNYNII